MGAWGHEVFANDSALDWVVDLRNSENVLPITAALMVVTKDDKYIEVDEGSAALAAAEVVAALKGKALINLPKDVATWIAQHHFEPDTSLVALAIQAIARVEQSSEVQELWEETEEYSLWRGTIQDLRRRLESIVKEMGME